MPGAETDCGRNLSKIHVLGWNEINKIIEQNLFHYLNKVIKRKLRQTQNVRFRNGVPHSPISRNATGLGPALGGTGEDNFLIATQK